MKQSFVIPGKLPSLNEYISAERAHRQKEAHMKREWQDTVCMIIRAARLKKIKDPVTIRYLFIEPNRKRDKDNISGFAHKVIQDALVQTRVIVNDTWDNISGYVDEFKIDRVNPRIEVTLIS